MASQLTRRDDSGSNRYVTRPEFNIAVPQSWSSWSPTLSASSGLYTTASATGRFIQYGKTVLWSARIIITSAGTAAGGVTLTLPVAATGTGMFLGSGAETPATGSMLIASSALSAASAYIVTYNNTSIIGSGRTLNLGGSYEAA